MTAILQQQELANLLIHKLRAIDPYCIIAGGAPRDWYFGKEASDLDIYVYLWNSTPKEQKVRLSALGFDSKRLGNDDPDTALNYPHNPNITGVFDILGYDYKVQVIFLNIPTFKLLDTFSLSICKAWYSPERLVNTDTDFKLSVKTGIIFRTGILYNMPEKYLNKILSKFENYTYSENKDTVISKLLGD